MNNVNKWVREENLEIDMEYGRKGSIKNGSLFEQCTHLTAYNFTLRNEILARKVCNAFSVRKQMHTTFVFLLS